MLGRPQLWPAAVARACGVLVGLVGLLVFAGWVFDVPSLKGPLPGLVQMKADTAVGLAAMGAALLLLVSSRSRGASRVARGLAGLAVLIGAVSLAEYLIGRNLGIDQVLFRDVSAVHTVHPGRLAPQTAVDFVSLGLALVLLSLDRTVGRLIGVLTGVSFAIALLGVIGYVFGVDALNDAPSLTPIAPHTAVALLVLCVGIAASQANGIFVEVLAAHGPGSVVAWRLMPLIFFTFPLVGWLGLRAERMGMFADNGADVLLVLTAVCVIAPVVMWLAKRLNRSDFERQQITAKSERLAALVEASTEAIISADADGLITSWNRGAERLYGYTEAEMIGRPGTVLWPPNQATNYETPEAAARREGSVTYDTQRLHKDGSLLAVSVTLSPIDGTGTRPGFCVVAHDISDRLRAQVLLEERVRERTRELARSRTETLQKLALAAEYRDDDTAQHTERVAAGAARVAECLGLPPDFVALIREAAPLHDVGKIAIPDSILRKPGKLTDDEFETMKRHSVIGAELLSGSGSEVLKLGEQIALAHHERWDGRGYPAGLSGKAIPIAGRIVAVVDAFDAMTNDRPYRSALPTADALTEIEHCSGSQFDPEVVEAFLHATREPGRSAPPRSMETEQLRVVA